MRINRLEQGSAAAASWWPPCPLAFTPEIGGHRCSIHESDFTRTARLILELAEELDAIESDGREGRINSCEAADRLLSVWFAIKKLGKTVHSPDSPE